MTEERLHEIDQHIADGGGDCNGTTERALKDLMAEVRRLRVLADGRLEIIHMLRDSIGLYDGACTAALEAQP
jgi:hypothetical protein